MSNISKDDILRKIVEKTEEITGKELPDNIITDSDIPANTTYVSIERFNSVMKLAGYLNDNIYDVSDKEYIECMIYNTIVLILKHHKARMDYQLLSCIYTALCEIGAVINRIVSCDDVAELLNYVLWITYAAYCVGKGIQNEATEVCFEVDYDIAEISIRISDIDNVASIQDIICRLDEYFMDIEYYNITDKKYFDKLYKSNDQLRHNDVDNVENVINERESNMIRKEEFSRRRTPDVYTRRNGKLEKLNEKKPNSELIERMDCVINRLDKITGAVEKLVDNCNIEIHTDFDELNQKVSEKYNNKESNDDYDKTEKDKSTTDNSERTDWLDGMLDAALKVDYESLFNDDYLLDLKRTLVSALTKDQDKEIMDELSSKDLVNNKPNHSDDLDTSSLQLDNLLFEKDCTSATIKRMSGEVLDTTNVMKLFLDLIRSNKTTDEVLKKTIFCILGESGSGKDTLVEYTLKEFKLDLKPVLSYTDRPMRDGEQNGKEHIFLSKEEMTEFLNSNKKDIAAYTQIGETGYRYCAMTSVIDRSDIYIIDPNGLKEFKERTGDRYNIVSIYIDCPLKERRKRTEGRSDAVSKFEARVAAESNQFAKFREEHGYDHVIDNGSMSTIYRSAMTLADIFRYYKEDAK
nr:MAG TPA: Guanylate kinase [Caudoviricetes sp.]